MRVRSDRKSLRSTESGWEGVLGLEEDEGFDGVCWRGTMFAVHVSLRSDSTTRTVQRVHQGKSQSQLSKVP